MSNLIAAQRAYEMNAKVISAATRCCKPPPRCSVEGDDDDHAFASPGSRLLAASAAAALAQTSEDVIATPALRASVTVSSDVVRIGDILDNAGTAALIAIYRAPDLGTTGSLPTEKCWPHCRRIR